MAVHVDLTKLKVWVLGGALAGVVSGIGVAPAAALFFARSLGS